MTYLEKLTELLKKVEPIKKDLEELRFGTNVSWKDKRLSWNDDIVTLVEGDKFATRYTGIKEKRTHIQVLGNPIKDHHLRMYCENKIEEHQYISYARDKAHFYKYGEEFASYKRYMLIEGLDNTKPLNQQSDEVLKDIYNYLTK